MHLFYQPTLTPTDAAGLLSDEDARHATRTLRLGVGDPLSVTDGRGNRFDSVITRADKHCAFRVDSIETTPIRPFSVRICVAPTKNLDRIEWFVEKAVEIGIERISFFIGQHSERRILKLERIEKIAVAAMKQSLQSWMPQLDEAVPFANLLNTVGEAHRYIAHLPDNVPGRPVSAKPLIRAASPGSQCAVLVGPEGDFSASELQQAVQAGFQMVTLGPTRLRTETAALSACQALSFLNQ
ncbi:RsmE family RNA methyltransferase [Fibrivirga algicola]|uniref:Ribosomal RNA small subunit methyltransferase E n=1 Tax=Fibrivirga algicola TaxID=2950420 RepID=A0ABX0QJU9_9BACT|nr:RsmE family RNA methyltransferase [Fibrivirga algicola]ARK12457.1 16S rRNA (uracil(1498)-N(3))-methyltransferase [Fibrella sp. ES10-3-2-2]NID12406.1 16S rRNA (uracil(1498)-N(3))-methyltransferase [Fibrivirga algicola]